MTSKFVLTKGQQAAADAFFHFLMGTDQMFVLSGGPGTGKTFVMQHISKTVMHEYESACKLIGVDPEFTTLAFTATTNKAAEVLEHALSAPVQTIHSYMALKVTENFKTGATTLTKTAGWKIRTKMILFVDEYSMIDTALLNLIKESFVGCKLVFIGDHSQMAPVTEKCSPVFAEVDPSNFVFLTEPVRNADSPALVDLCLQLRDMVETGAFTQIEHVTGAVEYLNDEQMMAKLDEKFVQADSNTRILCYTNTRVEHFNAYIREIRGLPDYMIPGDRMVTANNYSRGKFTLNVEREVEIVSVDPTLHNAGYGELFADGELIRYFEATVKLSFGEDFVVQVPENKERWSMAIKEMAARKNWSDYFDLKNLCCDLRFKTACTVYKSQGSTYDEVFMDLGNIGTSWDAEQVARMLFVGASRARNKVYLFGSLPSRYTGAKAA